MTKGSDASSESQPGVELGNRPNFPWLPRAEEGRADFKGPRFPEGIKRRIIMRRLKFGILVTLAFLAFATYSRLQAQQPQKPLTNTDVVKMVKGGLPQSVIISEIKSHPANFDLSPDALIHLHRLGVPKGILDTMMAAGAQPPATTAPPAPASPPTEASPGASAPAQEPQAVPSPAAVTPPAASPSGLPSVAVLMGEVRLPIPIERTQLEETKAKPSSMLSLASDSALAPVLQGEASVATGELAGHVHSGFGAASLGQAGGLMSGIMAHHRPSQTYVWAVPNPASSNVLPTRSPLFSVDINGVPGVNPSEYEPIIVKLTPAQNAWRLVGATQGRDDATSSSAVNWQIYDGFLEDRVAMKPQKTAPGQYQVSPAMPLLPGEYAVVLRPISKSKRFSGADVARAQGDGLMFDAVWSFLVPPDAKP
jgi:hypothetical protein